jgi:hypothetical protein
VAISFVAHKGDCFVVALLAMTDPAKRTSILVTAITDNEVPYIDRRVRRLGLYRVPGTP